MNAGLLADIILGESPYLKGLVRHFNLVVLDQNGRITGFNQHFIRNSRKKEKQIMGQSFSQYLDTDTGKIELTRKFRNAMRGQPGSLNFSMSGSSYFFSGVILPVYHQEDVPLNIIIISKEEKRPEIAEEELQDFWNVTTKMLEEAGVSTSGQKKEIQTMEKPKILLVEDHKGLINKIFKKLIQNPREEVVLAPTTDAARLMAEEFKPQVLISHYEPIGEMEISELVSELKNKHKTTSIFLSITENGLRIEDGWLDIHVKNQADSVTKILELVQQLYW